MYGSIALSLPPFFPFYVTANQIGLTSEEEEEEDDEEEAKTRGGYNRDMATIRKRSQKGELFGGGWGGPDWRKEERGVFQLSRGEGI